MNYLTYKKRFKRILKEKTPICDKYGNQLENPENEKWVQCYNPHDKIRRTYPKYVFVSDKGNLVSIYYENRPRLLTPSFTTNDRESYNLSMDGETKHQLGYIIVAVCHGAKTFGKADEVMKARGRNAFGKSGDLLNVHHEDGYVIGDRQKNNNPEKMTILTVNIHKLFSKVPTVEATPEEELAFMQEFAERVMKETNEPVIMIPRGNGTGTINEVWNETQVTKFQNEEWVIYPMGMENMDLFEKWNKDEVYASLVENAVIEYCKQFLERGQQTITHIEIVGRWVPFMVFRRS